MTFKGWGREFPGCPVVRTLYFHCQGRRFNPWSGNKDPASCLARPKKNKGWGSELYRYPGEKCSRHKKCKCKGPTFLRWSLTLRGLHPQSLPLHPLCSLPWCFSFSLLRKTACVETGFCSSPYKRSFILFDSVVVNWHLLIHSLKYPCNWIEFPILRISVNNPLGINITDQLDWLLTV